MVSGKNELNTRRCTADCCGGGVIGDGDDLKVLIDDALSSTPLIDIHTHLFSPSFGELLLRGIDDLLTYHYLIAEVMRFLPMKPEEFYRLSKERQAELVWNALFVERSPVSESSRGVLTTLKALGLDTSARDLSEYRKFFSDLSPDEHVALAYKLAGIEYSVMTNDPFDREEMAGWSSGRDEKDRSLFRSALRLDVLLNKWSEAARDLKEMGYDVYEGLTGRSADEVRRFIDDHVRLMDPLYLAASLPPDFRYPDDSPRGILLDRVILPFCRENRYVMALMIGAKRAVNPSLLLAGDSLGKGDIESVERLCARNPENRFLLTMLSRENQHEMCATARKFSNLMIFGCWWFVNTESLIREITEMRIELLGMGFIPQHSDARVLDQVIYKWEHTKRILSEILYNKYCEMREAGWVLERDAVLRDVERFYSRNFKEFIGRG